MMKITILIFFLTCFVITVNLNSQTRLISISTIPAELELYQPFSCQIKINTQYANPFDVTDDIKIEMLVYAPSGKKILQPGFFYGEKKDTSFWGIRFTPSERGKYSCSFKIQTPEDTIVSKTFLYKVIKSNRNGFLHLNPESDYTFKFNSGQLLRAYGENVGWAGDYEYYFKKLMGKKYLEG